jgi:diamine N-acetyltransferase
LLPLAGNSVIADPKRVCRDEEHPSTPITKRVMSPHTAEQAMSFHRLDLAHLSEIAGLQVEESQLPFFAPTEEIVAEAIRNPDRIPMAIRVDGVLVGFFVFHKDRRRGRTWWLAWFMLDKRQQGKGYGKAAFRRIVRLLATRPQCERVRLQVTPGNDGARSIYVRAGFEDTDEAIDGDDVLELPVAEAMSEAIAGGERYRRWYGRVGRAGRFAAMAPEEAFIRSAASALYLARTAPASRPPPVG